MAFVSIPEAAKRAERLLEIVREAGGDPVIAGGVDNGLLSLWAIMEALSSPGDPTDPEVVQTYTSGAGIHDLAAKIVAVWDNIADARIQLKPHLKLLAETYYITQNTPNPRWDRVNDAVKEHGSADKVIELYWACLCILAGMTVELDDPFHSSDGANPDVIATSADGTRWAFALKTLSQVSTPDRAAKNLAERVKEGVHQILKAECDTGLVVVNLKNVFDHALDQPFLTVQTAHRAALVKIDDIIKYFYLNEVGQLKAKFTEKSVAAPLAILIAHTTALVRPPGHKTMFTELKSMITIPLPSPDEPAVGTKAREAVGLAEDLHHLVQVIL